MEALEFQSSCGRYGVKLPISQVENILSICKNAGEHETGGVIIGYYNDTLDWAVISQVITPPDSKGGRTWFYRGKLGLQTLFQKLWEQKNYYLGEWHFHPYSSSRPSSTDIYQMNNIATSVDAKCPEPILLILGGNPNEKYSIEIYVFPNGKNMIKLFPLNSN